MTLAEFLKSYGLGGCISIAGYCEEKRYDYTVIPEWVESDEDMAQFEEDELSGDCPAACLFLEPWWDDVKNRTVTFWNVIGGYDRTAPLELCIELEGEYRN